MISSSVTFPSAEGLIRNIFNKNSVEMVSNQIKGAVRIEIIFIGSATALAMPSGWFNPMRFGSNSPNTKEKNVKMTTTTATAIEWEKGFKLSKLLTKTCTLSVMESPLKIPVRIPIKVIPICVVDSNLLGELANSRAILAPSFPFFAAVSNRFLRAEISAISDIEKTPLRTIRKRMINNSNSDRFD